MSKENVRHYLAIFKIASPNTGYQRLSDIISGASKGDYKQVHVGGHCTIYAFATSMSPHQLDFSKIMINGDEVIFVEVTAQPYCDGFGVFAGWFHSHI